MTEWAPDAQGQIIQAKPIPPELTGGEPLEATTNDNGTHERVIVVEAADPLWTQLITLGEKARARGADPQQDQADIARARAIVDGIEARHGVEIQFADPALFAEPPIEALYPLRGFAMTAGPPTLLIAFSHGGKSVITQDLLLSTAYGLKAWGYFHCEKGLVVHLDYEQGLQETMDRYRRLARARDIDPRSLADGRIQIAAHPKINLFSPGAEDIYKRACDGKTIMFLDTFNAAADSRDENEPAIAEGLYMLGRASEATGCVIIVGHHMGKASLRQDGAKADPRTLARGSTAIVAAAGYVYAMGGAKGEPKLVQQAKARGLGDTQVEDFYLELAPVDVRTTWDYFNRANPADPGGFRVTYKTLEQVKPPATAQDKTERQTALMDAVLEYVRSENRRGRAVPSKTAISKNVPGRDKDLFVVADQLIERGLIVVRVETLKGHKRERIWAAELAPLPAQQEIPSAE